MQILRVTTEKINKRSFEEHNQYTQPVQHCTGQLQNIHFYQGHNVGLKILK